MMNLKKINLPEPIEPTIPQPPAPPPEPNLQVPATPKFPGCPPPPENSDRFLMQSLMGETPKTALHRFFIKTIRGGQYGFTGRD